MSTPTCLLGQGGIANADGAVSNGNQASHFTGTLKDVAMKTQ